jgi:molybdopterin converting factor small subunit
VSPGLGAVPPSDLLTVRVSLFGSLRELAHAHELWLAVARGTTVSELRRHLRDELALVPADRALVDVSALAFDGRTLHESQPLGQGVDEVRVAMVPPAAGR